MTAAQHDNPEQDLLPTAAHLACLVHSNGYPARDIDQTIARLTPTQRDTLLVVLASLIHPDQLISELLLATSPQETRTLRDLATDEYRRPGTYLRADDATARGELAELLVPEAAGLAMAVREQDRHDIADRLAGLHRHELEALTVVLAAMVDPDRTLHDALDWIDFDEHGTHAPGRSNTPAAAPTLAHYAPDNGVLGQQTAMHRRLSRIRPARPCKPQQKAHELLAHTHGQFIVSRVDDEGATIRTVANELRVNRETTRQAYNEAKRLKAALLQAVPLDDCGQDCEAAPTVPIAASA